MGIFSRRSNSNAVAPDVSPPNSIGTSSCTAATTSTVADSSLNSNSEPHNSPNAVSPPPPLTKPSLKKKLSDTNLVSSIFLLKGKKSLANIKNDATNINNSNSSSTRSSYNSYHSPSNSDTNGITVISVSDIVKPTQSQEYDDNYKNDFTPPRLKKKSSFLKNPFHNNNAGNINSNNHANLSRTPSSSSLKKKISITNMINIHKSSSKPNLYSNDNSTPNKISKKYLQNQTLDISAPASNLPEDTPGSPLDKVRIHDTGENTDEDDFGTEIATPYVPSNESFNIKDLSAPTENKNNSFTSTPISSSKLHSSGILDKAEVNTNLKDYSVNSENDAFLSPQVISPSRTTLNNSDNSIHPDSSPKIQFGEGIFAHISEDIKEKPSLTFASNADILRTFKSNQLEIFLKTDTPNSIPNVNGIIKHDDPQIVSPTEYILQSSPIETSFASKNNKSNILNVRERVRPTTNTPDSGNRFSTATVDSFYFRSSGTTPIQAQQSSPCGNNINVKGNSGVIKSPLLNNVLIDHNTQDGIHEPVTMVEQHENSNGNGSIVANIQMTSIAFSNNINEMNSQPRLLPPIDNSIPVTSMNMKHIDYDEDDEFPVDSTILKKNTEYLESQSVSKFSGLEKIEAKAAATPKNSIIESFNNSGSQSKSFLKTTHTKSPPSSAKRYSKLVTSLLASSSSTASTSPSLEQHSSSTLKKVVPAFISLHFKSSNNSDNNTPEKQGIENSANSLNARYLYSGPLSASSKVDGSGGSGFHLLRYSGSHKNGSVHNNVSSSNSKSDGDHDKTLSPIPLVATPLKNGLKDSEANDDIQIFGLLNDALNTTKHMTHVKHESKNEQEHKKNANQLRNKDVISNEEKEKEEEEEEDSIVNQRKHTSRLTKRISSLYYSSSKKNKKQLTIINISSPPPFDSLHPLSSKQRENNGSDIDDSSGDSSISDNDEESISASFEAAAHDEEIAEIMEASSIMTAKRVAQSPKEVTFNNIDSASKRKQVSLNDNLQNPNKNVSLHGSTNGGKKRLIAERVKIEEPLNTLRVDTDLSNTINNNFSNGAASHTLLSPIVEVDTPQNKCSPSLLLLPVSTKVNHNLDAFVMVASTKSPILEPPSSEFIAGRIVNSSVDRLKVDYNEIPVLTPVNETVFISPTELNYSNFLITPVSERGRSYSSDYEEPSEGYRNGANFDAGNLGSIMLNLSNGTGHERSTSKANIMNRLINNNDSGEVVASQNNNEVSVKYSSYKDDFTSPTHVRSSSMASSVSVRSRHHTRANSGNFKTPKMITSNLDFSNDDDIIDQTPIIHDYFKSSSQITLNHENSSTTGALASSNITKSPLKQGIHETAAEYIKSEKPLKIQIFKHKIAEKSPDIPNTFTVDNSEKNLIMSDIKSPISPSVLSYEALANNSKNSKPYDGALHSSTSSIDDINSMTSLSPTSSKFETPRGELNDHGNPYENHNNSSVLSHRYQSSSRLPIASTPIEMSKDPIFAKILKNGSNNNQSADEMLKSEVEEAIIIESPNKTFQQYDKLVEDYDATLTGSHSNISSMSKLRQPSTSASVSSFSTVNPFLEKSKSPGKSKIRRQNLQTLRALNGLGLSPEKPQSNTNNHSPGGDSTFSTAKSFVSASSSPINRNSVTDGKRNRGSGLHYQHNHSKQLSNSTSDSIYESIYRSSSLKSISQQSLIKKSPSIASSLDFNNRHRSRRFSLGIHEASATHLDTVKDTDIAEEYISMFVKASHSFDSTTLKNTDDSSICLSFKKGDNAFVYNVDSSGWAEVVLFNKEFNKGWVPINFFKKFVDESVPFTNNIEDVIASKRYLKPLLVASGEFLSIDPQEIEKRKNENSNGILTIGAYRDYINNIRDGVRLLLEYTNTITRTNAVVRKQPALRKVRKSLLAEWYQLFSYVDHHSKDPLTSLLLESLQKMDLKIISRAHIFLLVWAKQSAVYESEMAISKKNMISKRRQNRKIHQETVFYLSDHPNALDRFSQVKLLLYRYLLLILGRIDIIENNFYACEQLESVTHQIILLLRELLFVSKSATRLLHNDVSLYINNSYDDILSSLSDLVSSVKRIVTKTEHDEQKLLLNEEDSDIQIADDIDVKEFQYLKEGNKILRVAANTLDHISKVVKSCEKLLNTTGNFQLTASRKYPDFEKMNISNNEFIKCGLNQLLHNQIVVYKVTKHSSNWESHLPVGASCKYAYIRGNARSLTYSGSKLVQLFLKGDDLDYDIPLNNNEYDADYCMNNIISEIAYDDGSSNSSQYGNVTNFNIGGKHGSKHSSMISLNNANKKNQNVLGGSFKALVYLLTNERNFPSDFFITTFLLSFRNFSNARKLIYELIKRFDVGDRERQFLIQNNAIGYPDFNSFDSLMKKRRRNVLTVIQIWLESYFERDSDFVILPILLNFINDAVIEYLPQEGYKLCEICCKLIMRHSRRNQEFIDIQLNPKRIGLVKTNFESSNINSTSSSLNLLSPSTSENDMVSLHSAASSLISISLSLSASISNYSITSFRSKNQELIIEKLIGEFKSILQTEWFIGNSPLSLTKMIDSWFEICSKDLNLEAPGFYNELLQHNTVEIAKQLTDIESKIFLTIQPNELLDENFREKRIHLQKSRTIEKSVLFTNLLSDLVSDSIVQPGFTIKTRVNNLKQWIKIGLACYQLRNFNSLAAIITILQSAAISRLDKLWANLSAKYAETFDYLCKIVNPYKNYKVYRFFLKPYFQNQEEKKSQLPLVPYINLFLQDIIFATDGNRSKRKLVINGEEQSLINFDKYSKIVDCIARLQHLQIEYQYSSNGSNFENLNNSKASIFSLSKNAEGEYIENENEMNDVLVVNKHLEEFILLMLWGTRQKNLKDSDRFWKHSLEIQPGK